MTALQSPAYWRARMRLMQQLLQTLPVDRHAAKHSPRSLLYSYGYIAPQLYQALGYATEPEWIGAEMGRQAFDSGPLSFEEITSANTWFAMHPEKVAGKEILTGSRDFPLTIEGTRSTIETTLRQGLAAVRRPPQDSNRVSLMKMKLKLAQAKLLLESERRQTAPGGAGLSGLGHLDGLGALGALGENIASEIEAHAEQIEALLRRDTSAKQKLTFEETVRLYNQGISEDEIKAWVWYKRSLGFPMTGWEKFYLRGSVTSDLAYAARNTLLKDNHFRDLETVKAGRLLGKPTRFRNEYDGVNWRVVTMPDNRKVYVRENDLRVTVGKASADPAELDRLVTTGALCYEDGNLVPLPVYLFGNMYDKELQLRQDQAAILERYGEAAFNYQTSRLATAKPRMLSIQNQDPRERPIITSVSRFAQDFTIQEVREEYSETEKAREYKKVNGQVRDRDRKEQINLNFNGENAYGLRDVFKKWLYTLTTQDFEASSAIDVVTYYLENRPLKDDGKNEAEKKQLKAEAREEGERLFQRFLNEVLTFDDQQRLDFTWNRLYNAEADIAYHKVPIGFECSGTFKRAALEISPVQRQGVAFMEIANSGICAFDVGVGKTMTANITLANALYSGRGKRMLLVVPNAVYDKWIRELFGEQDARGEYLTYGVLSGTDYRLNDWYNLGTDVVKRLVASGQLLDQPVAEKSITLLTFEGLNKIGFSARAEGEMLSELSKILLQSDQDEDIETILNERKGNKRGESARDKEKKNQSLRTMIGEALMDTICDYDTLGFDFLVIDEAHNFKNVFANVSSDEDGNRRYNLQSATSKRGVKAFFLCNYIQRRFRGNVMLLTATPFTNSPLEVYSMLSLVAYHSLVSQHILNIREFFDQFVIPTVEWAVSVEGKLTEKEVIKNFINRLSLQKLIHNHILYKTGEDANVPRPCKINLPRMYERVDGSVRKLKADQQVLTYLKMNALQAKHQADIVGAIATARAVGLQKGLGKALLFEAMSKSLNNALSPFLISTELTPDIIRATGKRSIDYRLFVDYSPKVDYAMRCIRSVKAWHEARGETSSGQVLYANRGKDFFPFLKEYLEKEIGFRASVRWERKDAAGKVMGRYTLDEVEILTGDTPETRRENIKDAFLDGTVKVLIGTSTIREGIDLQKRGTVIYNLLPEWNPTDIKQLEGRIWRQGNDFGYVRIVMPLVQDSMDVFIFQKLEEKSARINDLWFKAERGNVLDLESLDPEEIKYALLTDLKQIARMMLEKEREEHQRKIKVTEENVAVLRSVERDLSHYRYFKDACQKAIRTAANNVDRLLDYFAKEEQRAPGKVEKDKFKKLFDFVGELKEALFDYLNDSAPDDKKIVALRRKFRRYGEIGGATSSDATFGSFAEYLSKIKKAERAILTPKGYSLDSDLSKVLEEYQADLGKLKDLVGYYEDGGKRFEALLREAKIKKSSLQIDGKSVQARAEDFASLNYLLAFGYSRDLASCELPSPQSAPAGNRPPVPSSDSRAALIKIKLKLAKAKLLLEREAGELRTAHATR